MKKQVLPRGYFSRWGRLLRHQSMAAQFSGMERQAVDAANGFERDTLILPLAALLFLSMFYGLAGLAWSYAIRSDHMATTAGGASIGLLVAVTICRRPIFVLADDQDALKARQIFVWVWINIGIVLAVLGGIACGARSAFGS